MGYAIKTHSHGFLILTFSALPGTMMVGKTSTPTIVVQWWICWVHKRRHGIIINFISPDASW